MLGTGEALPDARHAAPAAMGYSHCESCRSWSAAPVDAFTLWKPDAVICSPSTPGLGLTDVHAAAIPHFAFRAGVHVNCQETTLRLHDGLPKMKDVPQEVGGSGVTLAE